MTNIKVCHLTSVHPRYDIRIFLKESCSLASFGYQVSLIVADGKGDEVSSGISIFDVGVGQGGRVARILKTTRKIFQKALSLDALIYHLHDPELIPIGLKLKKRGKKVIFDAHEDLPSQLMGKPYLNKSLRFLFSKMAFLYEQLFYSKLDAIVTATPFIRDKFKKINPNVLDINNFPLLGELDKRTIDWSVKRHQVCYIGGISPIRGVFEAIKAMSLVQSNVQLKLAGRFRTPSLEAACKIDPGWKNVEHLGFLARSDASKLLQKSIAGIVTFLPVPNHINAQPNKMFEYMSAGVPVISSNFPLWREIIEGNHCGICVDPLDPESIAEAIDYLMIHPDTAEQMGKNGQQAVQKHYNWASERKKLINFYSRLIGVR